MKSKVISRYILPALATGTSFTLWQSHRDWSKYKSSKPEVAKHSDSINSFLTDVQQSSSGRFVQASESFIWQTRESDLIETVRSNFGEIADNVGILDNKESQAPVHTDTQIKTDEPFTQGEAFKKMDSVSNVSAGGFPALWSAYVQSVLHKKGILSPEKEPPVYVMPPNIKNSAYYGSSTQFHVSHATPMYTDPEFGTFNIMMATAKRTLFPTKDNPEKDNYMIGEIAPEAVLNPDVIAVGLGYLFHEMKYKFNSATNKPTIADETIPLAIKSGKIMDDFEKDFGKPLLLRGDTVRVAYDESETKEMLDLQKQLKTYSIDCKQLSPDEVKELTGTSPAIGKGGSIWSVKGDGNMVPDIVDMLTSGIKKNGGKVIEGYVSDIYYDEKQKSVVAMKVGNTDSAGNNTETIIKTNNIFASFGARAKYNSNQPIEGYNKPEPIISGTGYSAYLLVEGNIKKPIDSNNSHFTPLATAKNKEGKDITLVKSTCGGAIGTDSFCIDHAINSLHYATKVIFPDKKVEIITAKSCSRPLNGRNSGVISEVVHGLYAATGFGGKGVTDAAGFAMENADKLTENESEKKAISSFAERYKTEKTTKSTSRTLA